MQRINCGCPDLQFHLPFLCVVCSRLNLTVSRTTNPDLPTLDMFSGTIRESSDSQTPIFCSGLHGSSVVLCQPPPTSAYQPGWNLGNGNGSYHHCPSPNNACPSAPDIDSTLDFLHSTQDSVLLKSKSLITTKDVLLTQKVPKYLQWKL